MAAAVEIEEKLKDITDCPICLETFKEPKILPCIHTFCMHCLQKTGEKLSKNPGDMMPCPVCRKEFTVPETGFGGLQKNFFMDKLTEMKNIIQPSPGNNLCDACQKDNKSLAEADIPVAETYCVQCLQRLCGECYKHHRKQKLTRNHRIIAIDESKPENLQETLKMDSCEKHLNSLLEMYCSDCQDVVCATCFVENHKSHDGSDANKAAIDFGKQIKMNVDEVSSFLPRVTQKQHQLDTYKTEFERRIDDMQTKINRRRQELKELVDKDADSLLSELDSIRQHNLKKCKLDKEYIEIMLVSLKSYKSYCLQLITVGSASDICRAKTALDARTNELKRLYTCTSSSSNSWQLSNVSLKITELQDDSPTYDHNMIGELKEHEAQTSGHVKDDYLEMSSYAESCNLRSENLDREKLIAKTSRYEVSKSTPMQEDEENNEEFLDCVEWNDDVRVCVASRSIEPECLSELKLTLTSKVKEVVCTTESSLHDELNELRQNITNMLETVKLLEAELGEERVLRKELELERNMLADRTNVNESYELRLHKMVEDLKRQNDLLTDLVTGAKEHPTRIKGNDVTCDSGVKFYKALQNVSDPNSDSCRIFGIAVLANELYVLGNDGIVIIYDLSTLRFKRRWKIRSQDAVHVEDLKQCDTNKCLYIMKVGSTATNEIQRVDPFGRAIAAWSVGKASGKLSVTPESTNAGILLTVTNQNRLLEFTPDGILVQVIKLSWDYGIENPLHAIKLTSEQFLICHRNKGGELCRVCIVGKAGNVLKYFGEPCKKELLQNPIYLDFDGGGNILVVDYSNQRVLLLSSYLEPKLSNLGIGIRKSRRPRKVCFDKSNGRVLLLEEVYEYDLSHTAWVRKGDEVSIFVVNNPKERR